MVWKLASYSRASGTNYLNAKTVASQMNMRYRSEFVEGKRSFFHKVIEKDEVFGRHFVGLVASIDEVKVEHGKAAWEIKVSDGYYVLSSYVPKVAFYDLESMEGRVN